MFSLQLFKAEMYLWWKAITLSKDEEGFYLSDGKMDHLQGEGRHISSRKHSHMKGIFTHFHPLPQPRSRFGISYGDVSRMLECEDKQIRAVYPHGVYRVMNQHWEGCPESLQTDWRVMLQDEGRVLYTPITKEDKWITEEYASDFTYDGWLYWVDTTLQKDFKPLLKDILGLTLDLVPFGVI